jgi:hypothetical protein
LKKKAEMRKRRKNIRAREMTKGGIIREEMKKLKKRNRTRRRRIEEGTK